MVSSVLSLLYNTVCAGSIRARNRWSAILRSLPENFTHCYTHAQSIVYIVFSIEHNNTYIGQTERALLKRFKEEQSAGLAANRSGSGTLFETSMGRVGVKSFSVIPLALLGTASKFHRLRAENRAILHFNSNLNSTSHHRRCNRLSRRRRALKAGKIATRRVPMHNSNNILTFTRFFVQSAAGLSSFCSLDAAIMACSTTAATVSVSVCKGVFDLSNYHVLQHDVVCDRTIVSAIRNGSVQSASLKVKFIRTRSRSVFDQLLFMAKHPHSCKKLLRSCSVAVLLDLWIRLNNITNNRLRERAQIRLRTALARACHVQRFPSCVVRVPFDPNIRRAAVVAAAVQLIQAFSVGKAVKEWLQAQVRVVFAKHKSIAQHLINNRQFAAQTTLLPPTCSCNGQHVCVRLSALSGSSGAVGKFNSACVPIPSSNTHSWSMFSRAFREFVHNLAPISGVPPAQLKTTAENIVKHLTARPQHQPQSQPEAGLSVHAVVKAKAALQDLVVSRLDKNSGQLLVECKVSAYQRLNKVFLSCPHFQQLPATADHAMRTVLRQFKLRGLDKFAAQLPGSLPYAYADPKDKDLTRSRGIVSYCRHPCRSVFRLASKALTFLLLQLAELDDHFTLFNLDRLPEHLHTMLQKLLLRKDSVLIPWQTDVTEMFTNLAHKGILDSVRWLFDMASRKAPGRAQYRSKVAVYRFGQRQVRWGVSYNDNWKTLTFSDILNIIEFDLSNIVFTVGNIALKQNNGAPIGGFISAFYGNVVCARAEYQYCQSLGCDRRLLAARRCQDDLFAVAVADASDPISLAKARAIQLDFEQNRVYKDGLSVKPVPIEGGSAKFVGTAVDIGNRSLFCTSHNRNWPALLAGVQPYPRFHHWLSYVPRSVKLGVLIGAIRRTRRLCSFDSFAVLELSKLLMEFSILGYPDSILLEALHQLHHMDNNRAVNHCMSPLSDAKATNIKFWINLAQVVKATRMKDWLKLFLHSG
jgi:hypothetical protein